MRQLKYDIVGSVLAVTGSILSVTGALINNLWLDHTMAMWFWMFSNPILGVWAYGNIKDWWDGGVSVEALLGMYLVFTISNFWGLFLGGI